MDFANANRNDNTIDIDVPNDMTYISLSSQGLVQNYYILIEVLEYKELTRRNII